MDVALFTGVDAKMAFLAAFEVDCDPTFFQRGCHSFKKIRRALALKPARPFLRNSCRMSSINLDSGDLEPLQLDRDGSLHQINGDDEQLPGEVRADHKSLDALERAVHDARRLALSDTAVAGLRPEIQ